MRARLASVADRIRLFEGREDRGGMTGASRRPVTELQEVRTGSELDGAVEARKRDSACARELLHAFAKQITASPRILGQGADAEDATQEIFLRVREKADGFDGRGSFSAWLRRLALNHCLNRLAERRRREGRIEPCDLDRVPTSAPPKFETAEALERALSRLPDDQRAVLVLREVEGLTYREISEALSIPAGTVMSRLARARERLLGVPGAKVAALEVVHDERD
jgi:RNA polymerase sigma-70 factor (ECF subfamily)